MQRRSMLRRAGLAALTAGGVPGLVPGVSSGQATAATPASAPPAVLPPVSEGPFYPSAAWRAAWTDWDADLTRVEHRSDAPRARGEALGLEARVVDSRGRAIDRAEVEIWQCDALAVYHHPRVTLLPGRFDPGFAGFGATRSLADGTARFRTIRPVAYPGRTPHIHLKLRHPSFGEITSQLFVRGEPGNAGDFLWQRLSAAERDAVDLSLQPAPAGTDLRWIARPRLVVPA